MSKFGHFMHRAPFFKNTTVSKIQLCEQKTSKRLLYFQKIQQSLLPRGVKIRGGRQLCGSDSTRG